ncbi:hypothetical protein [Methylobacterium nodulans]|uniref:Uncharacterized protein n=1 Tax=Methylobacterium nodulans (strain LMG 21967 / CNCM I-2342 / ORS 2060) TaxID=460265 RepID=B8ILH2_METNO|nr:hypothetical protein [Methylobacterium nodulans]ACL60171.1 conserved hypothetical protein [Methylobacterium nodulans ORS 2060]
MPADPINARTLAAALALGGLATMMLAPAPSWSSVGIGVASLVAYGILSLLAGRQARPPGDGPRHITVEVVVEDRPRRPRPAPPPPPPAIPRALSAAHPAIYKAMRVRRIGR